MQISDPAKGMVSISVLRAEALEKRVESKIEQRKANIANPRPLETPLIGLGVDVAIIISNAAIKTIAVNNCVSSGVPEKGISPSRKYAPTSGSDVFASRSFMVCACSCSGFSLLRVCTARVGVQ